ncbi:MAG: head GIN domain-containing protein [Leeuwenhoekiella sp.]
MKKVLVLALILLGQIALAQEPITKDVGDFQKIKVFDRIVVSLIKAESPKVVITGADSEDVNIINKDGLLKVRMEIDKIFNGDDTFVKIYYTNLELIDGNEGSRISTEGTLQQGNIELRAQEGAVIKADLKVKKASMRAVTGGIIETYGTADKQQIEINTGGVYSGKNLETFDTSVRVQAGGEVEINAARLADVKIRAGGNVDIYGNPKEIKQNTFVGGKIREMN